MKSPAQRRIDMENRKQQMLNHPQYGKAMRALQKEIDSRPSSSSSARPTKRVRREYRDTEGNRPNRPGSKSVVRSLTRSILDKITKK